MAASSPLPIAAVQVMIHDRPDKLATTAPTECNYAWDHKEEIRVTKARVNSRCQDLLAVVSPHSREHGASSPSQLCRVEFLHRSVRDFLNESESVQRRLDEYAGHAMFNTDFNLLACYVFLIKRVSTSSGNILLNPFRGSAVDWSNEALIHLRKLPPIPSTLGLLRALDDGMQRLYVVLGDYHWSNHLVEDPLQYCTPPKLHDLDVTERGGRNLLGHLIELGLISYVKALLNTDPLSLRRKKGRPYLDYALRYRDDAPFRSKYPKQAHQDHAMIKLLLDLGCDVNEVVQIHGNRTVWDSYLYYLYASSLLTKNAENHQKSAWLLVNHGAEHTGQRIRPNPQSKIRHGHDDARVVEGEPSICMEQMLTKLFGQREAEDMQKQILTNTGLWKWSGLLSWLGPKHKSIGGPTHFSWTKHDEDLRRDAFHMLTRSR